MSDASYDGITIRSMVAFLQKLPELSPAAYEAIAAPAPPDGAINMDAELPTGGTGHVHVTHADTDAPAPVGMPTPLAPAASAKRQRASAKYHR